MSLSSCRRRVIDDYKDDKAYTFTSKDQSGTGLSMVMNTRKPPLSDMRVRQAILYAADQDAINDILYDGYYAKSEGPLNNNHPCFWSGASEMYKTDLKKAAELLDAAGWKLPAGKPIREASGVAGVADGTPLRIRYNVLHHKEIGEVLQQQLRKAGIELAVEVVPGPVQIERVRNRDFELMYERQRSPDPGDPRSGMELQMGSARRLGLDRLQGCQARRDRRQAAIAARCRSALRGGEGGAEDHHGKRPDASDAERSGFRRLSNGQGEGLPDSGRKAIGSSSIIRPLRSDSRNGAGFVRPRIKSVKWAAIFAVG